MRTGDQAQRRIDRFPRSLFWRRGGRALHMHPELVASLAQHESGAVVGQGHVVEIGLDGVGGRNLSQRPVVTPVPARELVFVTRTTRLRTHVTSRPANVRQTEGGVSSRDGFFRGTIQL